MDRKSLAIKSSTINLAAQMVSMVISLANRKVFLMCLGDELAAIQSVLQGVLGMLALTELGIQTAIVFRLYQPLATGDHQGVSKVVSLLRRLYTYIGLAILGLGLLLIPFLGNFFTGLTVGIGVVRIVYLLLLASSVVTYFMAYKRTLLYADQKQYIPALVDMACQVVFALLKILVMVLWRNFYLYLLLTILQNIVSNLYLNHLCDREYPWLSTREKADPALRHALFTDTKDIFTGRVASYIYGSTDNLVISALINTILVTPLGNYRTIIDALKNIISQCMGPIAPMIGNYVATETKDNARVLFKNYTFLRYTVALVLLIPTLCLSTLVVTLYYGPQYELEQGIILLLVLDIYMACLQGSAGEFISALGYFRYDKYVYFLGAFLNVTTSIVGALTIGLSGVLLGTVASQTVMWIGRSWILYHYYFDRQGYAAYWMQQLLYGGISFGLYLFLWQLLPHLPFFGSWFGFVSGGCLCEAVILLVWFLCFHRTAEFAYTRSLGEKVLRRFKK